MVKRLLTFFVFCSLAIIVNAQMYVQNGNFETWTFDGDNLPNNWNSFQTADGLLASTGYSSNNRQVIKQAYSSNFLGPNGETTGNCCAIWARSVWGVVAQGNLTTGRVHAGGGYATHIDNYNYSDRDGSSTNGDVTNPCAMKFTGKPDSIVAWVKFVPKKELTDNNTAKLNATIHTDNDYISYGLSTNDNDDNKALVVGMATNSISYYKDSDGKYLWQRLSAAFDYSSDNDEKTPAYILVDVATNGYPGKGTANDYLYVDNIEMVYNYTEPLYVNIKNFSEGEMTGEATTSSTKQVSVGWNGDGSVNFRLSNFVLEGEDGDMPVGNISIDNLTVGTDKSFTFKGNVYIKNGDSSQEFWLGPFLGEIPVVLNGKFNEDYSEVYVSLDIDMTADEDEDGTRDGLNGQKVKVHLGYARATMAVNSDAHYGTFCAPFAVTIPNGVTASTVTSVDANGLLTLTALSTTIPANTPVVLYAESGYDETEIFGVAVSATTLTSGLLTGVYTATTAPEGSYVLQNQDGNVAFYLVTTNDITVPANRCYLTTTAPVKALVFPDGTQTSISAIQANDEKAVMYDLSGRRVSKATKGIYITNGKKVLVK